MDAGPAMSAELVGVCAINRSHGVSNGGEDSPLGLLIGLLGNGWFCLGGKIMIN